MIGIYKITSPSGKIYIGQSTDIEYRFRRYKRLHCKSQTAIYNSLLSYGVKNHVFETIEECEISEHTKLMISKNNGNKSSVINSLTNNIYSSIKEASEKENISYCYLRKMLCGKHPNRTNLKYYKK